MIGTWMQGIAQSWLVLQVSGSSAAIGFVVAAQFLPVLLFAPYGGLIVDRTDKRRLLLVSQVVLAALALLLGLLTMTHLVRLWMIAVLAVLLGIVNAVDTPARQTFIPEIVGPDLLQNAVSLNSVMTNAARTIGPAIAGVLISSAGTGVCFVANGLSFFAVIVALMLMRTEQLRTAPVAQRQSGQLLEGFRYVCGTAGLWAPLLMMTLVGTLGYEFQVILPVLSRVTLHGDASTYGFLTAAMGIGAVIGGLIVAARGRAGMVPLVITTSAFAATMLLSAAVDSLVTELVALALVGATSTAFLSAANTTLQLISRPHYRGRVMALWTVTFLGTTPIGGPLIGVVVELHGPRCGLAVGAATCLVAAVVGVLALRGMPASHRLLAGSEPAAPATQAQEESDLSN
jgi:MFS family permease